MKPLTELGISPWPWVAEDTLKSFPISSCSVRCNMYDVAQNVLPSDSRLIAAAPELYDSLQCLVEEMCRDCPYCEDKDTLECHDRKCSVNDCKAVLLKAAGEEKKND